MSSSFTVNGNIYTWPDQFQAYSYVTTWPRMINDCVAQFADDVGQAQIQATASAAAAAAAAASAATATTFAATQATSTTSLTIALGTQTLTVQTGKGFANGMQARIAKNDGSQNFMDGVVTSYNSGTGTLVVNVTQVTGTGTLTAWNVFMEGPLPVVNLLGGGNVSSGSTSITLTAASSRSQNVTFTAQGLGVTLPDATTLITGGPVFSISNSGQYAFAVRRHDASILTVVSPGGTADVYLDANGTVAGVWHVTGQGLLAGLLYTPANDFTNVFGSSSSAAGYWQCGNTVILMGSNANNNSLYAQAIDISQSPVAVGAPVLVASNFIGSSLGSAWSVALAATPLDATHLFVAFATTAPSLAGIVLTLTSSTTISPSGASTIVAAITPAIVQAAITLSSSLAVVTYGLSSGTALAVAVPFSSGVIGVAGSPAGLTNSTATSMRAAQNKNTNFSVGLSPLLPVTATSFIWCCSGASTAYFAAATISGTTITLGSISTSPNGGVACGFIQLSASAFIIDASAGASGQSYTAFTVSGNAITAGSVVTESATTAPALALAAFSASSVGILMSAAEYMVLGISGTTITETIAPTATSIGSTPAFSVQANQIVGWTGPSDTAGRPTRINVATMTSGGITNAAYFMNLPPGAVPVDTPQAAGQNYALYPTSTSGFTSTSTLICLSFAGNIPAYAGYATGFTITSGWKAPWALSSTKIIVGAANGNSQLLEMAS